MDEKMSLKERLDGGDLEEKWGVVRALGWNLLLDDGNLLWDYKKTLRCIAWDGIGAKTKRPVGSGVGRSNFS